MAGREIVKPLNQVNVEELKKGTEYAWEDMFSAFASLAGSVAVNLGFHDPDVIDEIVQLALINVYKGLHTFKGGNFHSWVASVVANTAKDMHRKLGRRKEDSIQALQERDEKSDSWEPWLTSKPRFNPVENAVLLQELKDEYKQILRADSVENRSKAMRLYVEDGLTYNEIAQELKVPLGSIKSHIYRARSMLSNLIDEE